MKIFVSVLVLCFIAAANAGTQVVGGDTAPRHKYPYLVSIHERQGEYCGGSIINNRWILTAAHCLTDVRRASDIRIHAGSNEFNGGDAIIYPAEYFVYNENYNSRITVNDVGLIRVNRDIDFNDRVQALNLPTQDFTDYGVHTMFAGWGATRKINGEWELTTNELQEIEVEVVDQGVCNRQYAPVGVRDSQICVNTRPGSHSGLCFGDSGSPLVVDGTQIGLDSYSRSSQCATGIPDVMTRVYSYVDWIQNEIQSYERNQS